MSKGNTPLDHHTVTNEPHMLGKNGVIISRAEFARRCSVHDAYGKKRDMLEHGQFVKARKYAVYFGQNEDGRTWKYRIAIYCTAGKREALRRSYDAIKLFSMSQAITFSRFGHLESYDMNYNGKFTLHI